MYSGNFKVPIQNLEIQNKSKFRNNETDIGEISIQIAL